MADTKISALTDGTALADTDRIPVARSPFGAGDNRYVSGTTVYRPGSTDVALADGGTGASLSDPNADRIMFWDDSAGAVTWLTPGTGLTITGTTIDAASGSGDVVGPASSVDEAIVRFDGTTGKLVQGGTGITISDSGIITQTSTTVTASTPNTFSQTFNNAAVGFVGHSFEYTDTASAGGSEAFRVRVGVTSVLGITKSAGAWVVNLNGLTVTSTALQVANSRDVNFTGTRVGRVMWGSDAFISSAVAATIQLGAADAASPVAQTLRSQGSRAGTDSNVAGGNLTIMSGTGTGNAAASSLILRSPVAVASGTTTQTVTTGATIKNGTTILPVYTVATLPTGEAGAKCFVNDANATTFHSIVAGGGANFVPVFHDGTDWRIG